MEEFVIMPSADYQDACDAIREKTSRTDLIKSGEFGSSIRGIIQNGEEVFFTKYGVGYVKNMELDITQLSYHGTYAYANHMETISLPNFNPGVAGYGSQTMCDKCTSLKSAYLPKMTYYSHYVFRDCTALEHCQLGSIGNPVTDMGVYTFYNCSQEGLEITVYVDAETLADIPVNVTKDSPWRATNATIIYRNSTTGEVITA